jgi:hypothetical protein
MVWISAHSSCPFFRQAHLLIVVRDDVGDSRTWVLHLNPPIRTEGVQCDRAVVVQPVSPMLPEDGGLDTGRVGRVGVVAVLCFFKVSCVGAGCQLVFIDSGGRMD